MKTETITCSCGTVFQWTPKPSDCEWMIKLLRPTLCPDCESKREAELEEENRIESEKRLARAIAEVRDHVAHKSPQIFRGTDISHERFNAAGWARVKSWRPSEEKPWIGLIGETGTSKSRIACLLAAEVLEEQITRRAKDSEKYLSNLPGFHFAPYYKISETSALLQAGTFEQKEEARSYLDHIRYTKLLIIDDMGKGRINGSIAAEMFALVDHRYSNALPTIWTANSTPEQIAASMTEDMAAPFAGRINDSSRIIRIG